MSVSQGSKILASDCVSTNTASTLVLRDGSGNFSAGTITSLLSSSRTTAGDFISLSHGTRSGGCIKIETLGVANTEGWVTLILGNTTNKSEKDNASGRIKLYNSYGNYITIEAKYGVLSDIHATNNQNYIEISNYIKGTFIGTYYGTYYGTYTSNRTTVGKYITFYQSGTECGNIELQTLGTAGTSGSVCILLGNAVAKTTAGNASGNLTISRTATGYYVLCRTEGTSVGGLNLTTVGVANTEGLVTLILGNSTAKTAANNASGKIQLYNADGGYVTLTSTKEQWPGSSGTTNTLITTSMRADYLYPRYGLYLGYTATTSAPASITGIQLAQILPPYHSTNSNYWYLHSIDNSTNAFLRLRYNSTDLIQIRHDGAIKGSIITKVDTGNKTFTSSTSWFYTGAAVTIPAYCYYFIRGQAVYSNSGPTRVALSTTSTPTSGWEQAISYYGAQGYAGYVSMCGYTTAATTFYLHAVYNGASSNYARITGGYIKSWE